MSAHEPMMGDLVNEEMFRYCIISLALWFVVSSLASETIILIIVNFLVFIKLRALFSLHNYYRKGFW